MEEEEEEEAAVASQHDWAFQDSGQAPYGKTMDFFFFW